VKPKGVRSACGDGERFESSVEVEPASYVIEMDCEEVSAAWGVQPGQSGVLSFTVDKADGSGTVSVSAANAVAAGQRTRFRNEAKGLSVTTLRFVCRSGTGNSSPVSIS
jgi:hypothetical protein